MMPQEGVLSLGLLPFLAKHVGMLVVIGLGFEYTDTVFFALVFTVLSLVSVAAVLAKWYVAAFCCLLWSPVPASCLVGAGIPVARGHSHRCESGAPKCRIHSCTAL